MSLVLRRGLWCARSLAPFTCTWVSGLRHISSVRHEPLRSSSKPSQREPRKHTTHAPRGMLYNRSGQGVVSRVLHRDPSSIRCTLLVDPRIQDRLLCLAILSGMESLLGYKRRWLSAILSSRAQQSAIIVQSPLSSNFCNHRSIPLLKQLPQSKHLNNHSHSTASITPSKTPFTMSTSRIQQHVPSQERYVAAARNYFSVNINLQQRSLEIGSCSLHNSAALARFDNDAVLCCDEDASGHLMKELVLDGALSNLGRRHGKTGMKQLQELLWKWYAEEVGEVNTSDEDESSTAPLSPDAALHGNASGHDDNNSALASHLSPPATAAGVDPAAALDPAVATPDSATAALDPAVAAPNPAIAAPSPATAASDPLCAALRSALASLEPANVALDRRAALSSALAALDSATAALQPATAAPDADIAASDPLCAALRSALAALQPANVALDKRAALLFALTALDSATAALEPAARVARIDHATALELVDALDSVVSPTQGGAVRTQEWDWPSADAEAAGDAHAIGVEEAGHQSAPSSKKRKRAGPISPPSKRQRHTTTEPPSPANEPGLSD